VDGDFQDVWRFDRAALSWAHVAGPTSAMGGPPWVGCSSADPGACEPHYGESFLRVYWVAVPETWRARRVNRPAGRAERRCVRARGLADLCAPRPRMDMESRPPVLLHAANLPPAQHAGLGSSTSMPPSVTSVSAVAAHSVKKALGELMRGGDGAQGGTEKMWLFGGENGSETSGMRNGLWSLDLRAPFRWTWEAGAQHYIGSDNERYNGSASYGTRGVAAPHNAPVSVTSRRAGAAPDGVLGDACRWACGVLGCCCGCWYHHAGRALRGAGVGTQRARGAVAVWRLRPRRQLDGGLPRGHMGLQHPLKMVNMEKKTSVGFHCWAS
jgi:hypothetical protein